MKYGMDNDCDLHSMIVSISDIVTVGIVQAAPCSVPISLQISILTAFTFH